MMSILTFFQQNMALLPRLPLPNGDNLYRGAEREKSLARLAAFLNERRPDIAGLGEMWVPAERRDLALELDELYPYLLEGPGQAGNATLDGGLLLLSRYPIIDQASTLYRHCLGEDCLADKGAVHARISMPADPSAFPGSAFMDVFLTHLQNPEPIFASPNMGDGDSGRHKVQAQLDHLRAFITARRDPLCPALLLGDLNTDGSDAGLHGDLLERLGRPADLWLEAGAGGMQDENGCLTGFDTGIGLTIDRQSTFARMRQATNPAAGRHRQGERLDYFLSYPGSAWRPRCEKVQVLCLESSPGRDISDHYGLLAELAVAPA